MAKLLSSLPIGATVKFGKHSVNTEVAQPIIWVVADKNHSGYPTGSITLLAKDAVDLRAFDAAEVNVTATKYGNNNYGLSNINQWLNSSASAGNWYSPAHANDAPPNKDNVTQGTAYVDRAGFLYNFATNERNAILPTTFSTKDNAGTYPVTTKVFLPSAKELGLSVTLDDGSKLLPYISNIGVYCFLTEQAFTNTLSSSKPQSVGYNCTYWTRTPAPTEQDVIVAYTGTGAGQTNPMGGHRAVRPMLNLSESLTISTQPDADGCYTFSLTNAPSTPTTPTIVTSPVYTTKPCSIKWNASVDPNGDTFTYRVHLYYNGVESGEPIDVGTNTSYTLVSVKSGVTSIGFGVEAIDSLGHNSDIVMVTNVVLTNHLPTISSEAPDNLGNKGNEFSLTYNVKDADTNTVTVTEYIDNVKVRSYVATLGATNTFDITGNTWLKLANGIHTLKITANDGIDEASRTYTFTKSVNEMVIMRSTPIPMSTKPSRLVVTIVKNLPVDTKWATTVEDYENTTDIPVIIVEACNNGFAPSNLIHWENINSAIVNGQAHNFTNVAADASQWGVNIRVRMKRNGASGACYITEIGGNFE